jgi:hypothetical protein
MLFPIFPPPRLTAGINGTGAPDHTQEWLADNVRLRAENAQLQNNVEGLTRQLESAKDELAENKEWREHGAALSRQVSDLKQKLVAKNIIQQQLYRTQAEAAATWQQINSYCLYECGKDRDSCDDCGLSSKATSSSSGGAMLRVVEAARAAVEAEPWAPVGLRLPDTIHALAAALAEMDGEHHV